MLMRSDAPQKDSPFSFAGTVAVCKECTVDIWPGDLVLAIHERYVSARGSTYIHHEILCEDCGKLYLDSQELGQDGK
jgi:hypothetical protein